MNETNRTIIAAAAAAWIVLMAVVIFLAWAAHGQTVDEIRNFADYLNNHNDTAGKLIITLSALFGAVLGLLVIVLEIAPEDEERELRVEQAGATMIVPAGALRGRLEEALSALPEVAAARVKVSTRDKMIQTALELTVTPRANVAAVTQEASRIVVETIQSDLGISAAGAPVVKVSFGDGHRPAPVATPRTETPAFAPPAALELGPEPPLAEVETVDERITAGPEPPAETPEQAPEGTPGASTGPIVYDSQPPASPPPPSESAAPAEEESPGEPQA